MKPSEAESFTETRAEIVDELMALGPWQIEVEAAPGVSTSEWVTRRQSLRNGEENAPFLSSKVRIDFQRKLRMLFPTGLMNRSVLDCACNCGAFLFWARECGAGECFGFDVRDHWIRQAQFLAKHRGEAEIDFEVCDLYDLPELSLGPFDIVLFNGIFYHLPDPVLGLRLAANLARELIVVNTATKGGLPDGMLVVSSESRTAPMSGVYGLNWLPTGPEVLGSILVWLGFPEWRINWWAKEGGRTEGLGRLEVLAARTAETFATFDRARASDGAQ